MKRLCGVNISLPDGANKIIVSLESAGYEAFAVGGCVRDSLRGVAPHDWDIATNALPEDVLNRFRGHPVIETGLQHGTVTVMVDGEPYEITTYRTDSGYRDHRHPDSVSFVKDIATDLGRRDFTVNAMAYNHTKGLVDLYGGQADITAGVIRCVGNGMERFNEDALRILRALRFASVLGFKIDGETSDAIHQQKHLLTNIANERIQNELNRILLGKGAAGILIDYADVLCEFIPEIKPMIGFNQSNPYHNLDVWQHTVKSIPCAPNDAISKLTMLFHDMGKPLCYTEDAFGIGHFYGHPEISAQIALRVMKKLRYDNHTAMQVHDLVKNHGVELSPNLNVIRRRLAAWGEETVRRLVQIKMADVSAQAPEFQVDRLRALMETNRCIDEIVARKLCFSLKDLAVNGRDLMAVGISPGITVGKTLYWLLGLVIDGKADNKRDVLLKLAKNKSD